MADVRTWLPDATAGFGACLEGVGPEQWHEPTPDTGWDVRALVAHVADEQRWAPPLLAGRTIEDIGDSIPADPLGDSPVTSVRDATAAMLAAVEDLDLDATVHLSFGDVPAQEYLMQLFADHLIHTWDLARATGQAERLEPTLVEACATWFADREDLYRDGGVIGPAVAVEGDGSQDALLGRTGRNPSTQDTLPTIVAFNRALGSQDLDATMALMTEDCVFESTSPPDGQRYEGRAAVRAVWEELFASSPEARFVTEHTVIAEDRATYQWRYDWGDGHIRGIDLFKVRDGKVAEKFSYVKG